MSTLLNRVRSHLRNLEATAWNAEGLAGAVKIVLHEELPRGEFANRERLLALVLLAGTYSDKAVIDVVMRLLGWKDRECQELSAQLGDAVIKMDEANIESARQFLELEEERCHSSQLTESLKEVVSMCEGGVPSKEIIKSVKEVL